jgi:hypothetical protein
MSHLSVKPPKSTRADPPGHSSIFLERGGSSLADLQLEPQRLSRSLSYLPLRRPCRERGPTLQAQQTRQHR